MKIKNSLRKKLIISIFIGCLIPYFIGGFYLKNYIEKWLFEDSIDNTNQLIFQIGVLIDKTLIENVEELVTMISQNNHVKEIDDTINNYLEYEANNFIYKNSNIEMEIEKYFGEIKSSYKSVNFIFLGTESGGYIEFPKFKPEDRYDPRVRPWYINAMKSDKIEISDPYVTQMTNEMILSFAKKIEFNNGSGVIGISFKIDDLARIIRSVKVSKTGCLFVLNENNKIVVSPNNPEYFLKTPEEIALNIFNLKDKYNLTYEANLDGKDKLLVKYIVPKSNWTIFSVIDIDEITEKSKEITNILIAIYLLTLLIVLMAIFFISKRITEPILGFSSIINKLAVFDLEFYKKSNVSSYLGRNDEIGVIAKALEGMENNFLELDTAIEDMNIEIQKIDIEMDKSVKLKLSENNPFSKIIDSFNILLEKIQIYMEKLKESNKENFDKNQLLIASEEELIAQLEEIDSQKNHIDFLAYHDSLTNLPNRRKFIEKLEMALSKNSLGAVILLDLDNFKGINDTLGHVYGDKVLVGVADRLSEIADEDLFVSRFGGDEFLILLENQKNIYKIKRNIRKILHIFDEMIEIDKNYVDINFSMGISLFPKDSSEVNQLIMNADLALYNVKNSGKNGYSFFQSAMNDVLIRKSQIETFIREAIETDGFKIVYQPQVTLETGKIYGYEGLIRFKDNSMSPADFIPIAENNGTIIKIGRIVAQKVIEQLRYLKNIGIQIKPISINFSAIQLHDHGFIKFIKEELEKNNIEPKYIEIEITENIFLENEEQTLNFLEKIRSMGIKISIDDFGKGYSSFSYLTFLPVDKIKLDQSLNNKFLEIENVKVMDSLILLAHSLNLEVVAEGIETREQFRRLCVGKCDYIQGYYFSKPIEADEIESNIYTNYYDSLNH